MEKVLGLEKVGKFVSSLKVLFKEGKIENQLSPWIVKVQNKSIGTGPGK